jgi:hypothetical protein
MAPRQLTISQRDRMLVGFVLVAFVVAVLVYVLVHKPQEEFYQFHHMTEGSYFRTFKSVAECNAMRRGFELSGREDGAGFCDKVMDGTEVNYGVQNYKPVVIDINPAPPHPDSGQIADRPIPTPKPKPRPAKKSTCEARGPVFDGRGNILCPEGQTCTTTLPSDQRR